VNDIKLLHGGSTLSDLFFLLNIDISRNNILLGLTER